jgi:hypothetical protein
VTTLPPIVQLREPVGIELKRTEEGRRLYALENVGVAAS